MKTFNSIWEIPAKMVEEGGETMITRDALSQGFTKRLHWFLVGALLVGLALGVWRAPVVHGASITVNSTEDTAVAGDGHCTLREAINNANADGDTTGGDCLAGSGADIIDFSVSGTITLGSTLPAISGDLSIEGAGQSVTISGNDAVRVMVVNAGVTVELRDLTVANGFSTNGGGGIANSGTLIITNSTFSSNTASGGGPGASGGGGIANFDGGMLTITNSTFSGNDTARSGGGIANFGTLIITNSTFSDNIGSKSGGGIANFGGGTLSITNSTFSSNSSSGFGGGIANFGTLRVTNSIIAKNTAPTGLDCSGPLSSLGHNLIGDNSGCSFTPAAGDLVGTGDNPIDPELGPLQDNGGPTFTRALLPGSPAIDAGDNATCAAAPVNNLDQRGASRPVDGEGDGSAICDIGAYELPQEQAVAIDIKPGETPNSINPRSGGVILVAILTKPTFDATTVEPLSVRFGPNGAMESHGRGHLEDADGDGDLDLVLHFRTRETGIQCGDTSAFLTGKTQSGQAIKGTDSIETVGCK